MLERWLAGKGFVRRREPLLFDLDGELERSVYLLSNDRWTVLFYSHYEEERRLIRELQPRLAPLFYVWVYDSEAWGFDVFEEEGFGGSWSSDPRVYRSFADEPPGTDRSRLDAAGLGRRLGLADDKIAELRGVEKRGAIFQEDVCRELCRILEVEVAASSYDDLEIGPVDRFSGWRREHWLFSREDEAEARDAAVNLHHHELDPHASAGAGSSRTVNLPPSVIEEMRRMQQRVERIHRLLRPVAWMARGWEGLRRTVSPSSRNDRAAVVSPRPAEPRRVPFRMESAVLVNERHRCRLTLAEGVRPTVASTKPSSVFAFEAGGLTIVCTARRRRALPEVLRKPDRGEILVDEKYTVADLPARRVAFELPPSSYGGAGEPRRLDFFVIQTPTALYIFFCRARRALTPELEAAIRKTVDSFRLLGETDSADDEERRR